MPTAPDDISFTRLLLGIGPKTTKQPTKQPTVAAPKKTPERVVLSLGGKLYTVVDIRKPSTMAAPGPPPPAATISAPAAASVGTPAPEPPAAAPEPAAAAPVAAEADATAEVPAWTDVQDALLLGLKALGNKTWKEIGKLFEGKDTEDLRERYAELTTVPKGETKVDAVVEEEKTTNTTDEETEGKNDKKSKKKNKKRGDTAETNDQEGNDEAVPGKKKKDKHGQDNQPKGILKPDEATQEQSSEVAPGQPSDNGAQLNYKGHPLITFDANDGLSPRELLYLSNLHERLEQEKWLQLASKLFDKTGKRVPSCVLREKFASLNLQ